MMDRFDEAKDRMQQRYEAMIEDECSTLWEKWSKLTGTRNHAWSGGPLVIMSKYFAGIRPVKPGYDEFVIKPQMAISCVVPSVKGLIKVKAERSGSAFVLDASLPKDSTAYVYIPYAAGQTIKINNKAVYENGRFSAPEGISFVEKVNDHIVFSLRSSVARSVHIESSDQS